MDDYRITQHIGDGAHGHVLKAFSLKRNKWMALKKIRIKKSENEVLPSEIVLREIKVLLVIDCKYVSTYISIVIISLAGLAYNELLMTT